MINCKLMVGKDALSHLNFEGYFNNCKSVLIISDIGAGLVGGARKIKKALPKSINVKVVKIKSSEFAEFASVQKCLKAFNECQADMIISVGSEIAHDIGKAVKYLASIHEDNFDCDTKLSAEDIQSTTNKAEISTKESADIKSEISNVELRLVCVSITYCNHHKTLTGNFDIYDKKKDIFYRLNKGVALPNSVVVDTKLLDRLSEIALLGTEIGTLLMSLIAIVSADSEDKKMSAFTALDIVGGKKTLQLEDLLLAQMCAGYDFLAIKNNMLDEYIFGAQNFTDSKYLQILILTMKKNISQLVECISNEDIKNIGLPYDITATEEDSVWRATFASVIEAKLNRYFADKDIPKSLSEIGLNSEEIEKVFDELCANFGVTETLTKLKDIVYSNY